MKAFILSSCTYMAEAIAELLLVISFLGKKKKSLLSPLLLLLPLCGLVNNFLFTFIPNVFGWFMTLPMSVLFYCLILHIPFFLWHLSLLAQLCYIWFDRGNYHYSLARLHLSIF